MITFKDICDHMGLSPKEVRKIIKGEFKIKIVPSYDTKKHKNKAIQKLLKTSLCKHKVISIYCTQCILSKVISLSIIFILLTIPAYAEIDIQKLSTAIFKAENSVNHPY